MGRTENYQVKNLLKITLEPRWCHRSVCGYLQSAETAEGSHVDRSPLALNQHNSVRFCATDNFRFWRVPSLWSQYLKLEPEVAERRLILSKTSTVASS
jgi:hypothetical protein